MAQAISSHLAYFDLPVGSIDLDALRLIFEYIADGDPPDQVLNLVDSWARLSHVCRIWRSTLLDMPRLWARDVLAFGTGSALDDIVARAQDIPLHLDCTRSSSGESALQRITPLISRAATFRCECKSHQDLKAVLDSIVSHPPEGLHSLSLGLGVGLNSWYISQSVSYSSCIEHLPLRHLEMIDVYLNPPLLGNLTSWTMKSTEIILVDSRLTVEAIVNVLAHNPGLETLSFADAIGVFRDRDMDLPDAVFLPNLRSLCIWQESNASAHTIIQRLQFPNPTLEKFRIRDPAIDEATDVSAGLACALSACSRSPALELTRFLRVECETRWGNKVVVQLQQRYRVADEPEDALNTPFHVEFQPQLEDSFQDLSSAIFDPLVRAGIPEQVTELSWYVFEEAAQVTSYWDTVLRPFKAVTTLIVLDVYQHTEASLIAMSAALSRQQDDGTVPLPRLSRLVMRAYEMGGLGVFWDHHLLQARLAMGAPIREVLFLDIDSPNMNGFDRDKEYEGEMRKQMEVLATELGADLESRVSWEDVDGERCSQGTEFIFKY